jgi:hypothetical protein
VGYIAIAARKESVCVSSGAGYGIFPLKGKPPFDSFFQVAPSCFVSAQMKKAAP